MRKPLVLVIDDHELMQQAIINILRLEDIEAVAEETGAGGLAAMRKLQPGLVFLDLNLKGDMNGIDVLFAIREDSDLASTPVILLTADELVIKTSDTLPADLILLKPIDSSDLVTLTQRLLGQSSQHENAAT